MTKPGATGSRYALWTLILAACVANLNLSVANVALPDIGRSLGASQVQLNMVAIGFTLGLAASVLYLGALGDRYGRKRLLLTGLGLSVPASAIAAWAPTAEVLIAGRLLGGIAAGMVYPTTLSIITALFVGRSRIMAIALWSGIGAGVSAIGPALVGWLLTFTWWGAGFAMTIPLALISLGFSLRLPAHTGESTSTVDHRGGVLSVIVISALIGAISLAPVRGAATAAGLLAIIAIAAAIAFVLRERRAANPIFDLAIARRRTFWVAAIAGVIVFGSLMGAFFIGQQFLQNVLGYDSFQAGLAILPAAATMIGLSPVAAHVIHRYGSRTTLLLGFCLVALGFIAMFTWGETSPYWVIGITYAVLGTGVAIAAAPASRAIMASVPASNLGMGSATNDLQRDLGGAIMQSAMGTFLVLRYASSIDQAFEAASPEQQQALSDTAVTLMSQSFTGAQQVAESLPTAAQPVLLEAAKQAFTQGSNVAYAFALAAVLAGMIIVAALYPGRAKELAQLDAYAAADTPEQEAGAR